ncbi:MAG: hypothetical protein GX458_19890 [Phyllobacteriaceae bacterium]|nr:hypothetical protein [Phyllobacteriaceae bacterium]
MRAPWFLIAGASLCCAVAASAAETPKFDLVLSLSPAALAELTKIHEQVTIAAMYAGEPTKDAQKKKIDDEIGEVNLGHEEITRPMTASTTTVSFVGKGFDAKRLKWVKPGTAKVLINVYSARKVNDDNLLDCGLFEDTYAAAAAKPIEISCKLIAE